MCMFGYLLIHLSTPHLENLSNELHPKTIVPVCSGLRIRSRPCAKKARRKRGSLSFSHALRAYTLQSYRLRTHRGAPYVDYPNLRNLIKSVLCEHSNRLY